MAHRPVRPLLAGVILSLSFAASALAQAGTPAVDATALSPNVTNRLFPLVSVHSRVYEGTERESGGGTAAIRVEETVLTDPYTIAGIGVTAVEVKEYQDGDLIEHTLDYYAQDGAGTVYYVGEDVAVYEGGKVVGHKGAWRAGEGKNQPGVFMPAQPAMGQTFEQEKAPGVAEDRSTVIALDQVVGTPAGRFTGCIVTEDVNPLDGEREQKSYCPDVGLAREDSDAGFIALVSITPAGSATPAGG